MKIIYDIVDTPLGPFTIAGTRWGICRAGFELSPEQLKREMGKRYRQLTLSRDRRALSHAAKQLRAYLAGRSRSFDLILDVRGTPFQGAVWEQLKLIPYAQTVSYSELARRARRPDALRAVAGACGSNPIAIFVPCHRVIGKDGTLTGYASGIDHKAWLLELEAKHAAHAKRLALA